MIVRVLVGAYPQERLCGHAGMAPSAINTRITRRVISTLWRRAKAKPLPAAQLGIEATGGGDRVPTFG